MTLARIIGVIAFPLVAAMSVHAQDWPSVALPKGVRSFDIGRDIVQNAMPMRVQGFVSEAPPDKLLELLRESMGRPLVESRWGQRRILGRLQGEFYVSVQVEPAGQGSRGTVALTHLKAAYDAQEGALRQREQWTSRLPAGSRVLSETTSRDGTKLSRHVVYVNSQGEASNCERLKSLLQEDGLALQSKSEAGKALFFKGRAKDAIAAIRQADDGQTTVVLNVVTLLGASQ